MTEPRVPRVASHDEELRIERKYVLQGASAEGAAAVLGRCPRAIDEEFAPREVNSLYFDSPDLRRYHAHRAGVGRRTKLRVRYYGARTGAIGAPSLELKARDGDLGSKRRTPLPAFILDDRLPLGELLAPLRDTPPDAWFGRELIDAEPLLFTRYARRYFRTTDGHVRITIDSHVEIGAVVGGRIDRVGPISIDGLVIVEIKCAPSHTAEAAAIGRAIPTRMTRMSKYVLGVTRLGLD